MCLRVHLCALLFSQAARNLSFACSIGACPARPCDPCLALHAEDERLRLRAQYEARIKALDGKVKAVAAKERRLVELETMKRKVGA